MIKNYLRIATRTSFLAMRQTEIIKGLLEAKYPELKVEVISVTTKGDKLLHRLLNRTGGSAIFAKELERCLLDNQADVAIHSMKDVSSEIQEGLCIPTILTRDDHRDIWISNRYPDFDLIPSGAVVGVSSLSRRNQLLHLKPELVTIHLRGNVVSRVDKLDRGDFDAAILAAAGLDRLGFTNRITKVFSVDEMLPGVAQGAVGLQCRENDVESKEIVAFLHDYKTSVCIRAERAMNIALGGNDSLSIAGFAEWQEDKICLTGMVGSLDGKRILRASITGYPENNIAIGKEVAKELLDKGAKDIFDERR